MTTPSVVFTPQSITGVAIQADGKTVVVGSRGTGMLVVRYAPDGTLDASFGSGGIAQVPFPTGTAYGRALAIQADGKIVGVGNVFNGISGADGFGLFRLNSDGTLDNTFGTSGTTTSYFSSMSAVGTAVAIQPDGMVLAGGTLSTFGVDDYRFAVARYDTDGSLDPMFGSSGLATMVAGGTASSANTMALQPDGKIVLAGYASNLGGTGQGGFGLARFDADGSLDTTFGSSGTVTTASPGGESAARSMAVTTDGDLLVAGDYASSPTTQGLLLAEYRGDGTLEPSFGVGGIVAEPANSMGVRGVAIQADTKIVVAGFDGPSAVKVVRYDPDGSRDATFGSSGLVVAGVGDSLTVGGLGLQADGRIMVAGSADRFPGQVVVLARFHDRPAALVPTCADAALSLADGSVLGQGLINTTASGQTRSVTIAPGRSRWVKLQLANDGLVPADFSLAANGNDTFAYKITSGGEDATSHVFNSGWQSPVIAPGQSVLATVRISAPRGLRLAHPIYTRFRWWLRGSPEIKDVVCVAITVKKAKK